MTKPNARPLDAIAADIHKLDRADLTNIIARGKLLNEANDSCDHGEWLNWLQQEFAMSQSTAMNYRVTADLAQKFPTVGNLKVPLKIIYRLAEDIEEPEVEQPELEAIIAALAKASKTKMLSVAVADDVIYYARARFKFGDYPDATLSAMDRLADEPDPWRNQAMEAMKAKKPTTDEAAEKIVLDHLRPHVATYYKPAGDLPDNLTRNMLTSLVRVPAEQHKRVLAGLAAASKPLTDDAVSDICYRVDRPPPGDDDEGDDDTGDDGDDGGDDADDDGTDDNVSIVPDSKPAEDPHPDITAALADVLRYAHGPRPAKYTGGSEITGQQLMDIIEFVKALHNLMTGGDHVKKAADRAEASSRRRRVDGDA